VPNRAKIVLKMDPSENKGFAFSCRRRRFKPVEVISMADSQFIACGRHEATVRGVRASCEFSKQTSVF
jgi:hypothetical protein